VSGARLNKHLYPDAGMTTLTERLLLFGWTIQLRGRGVGLCPPFDAEAYRGRHLTPVYFGSALNNFGVRELLHGVGELAPAPRPQPAQGADGSRTISSEEPEVAGFVFKCRPTSNRSTATASPLCRIASGRFQRAMKLKNTRTGRPMSVQASVFFLARERELAEEAWLGDIICIPNHGSLRIGDTLTEGEALRAPALRILHDYTA